MTKEKENRPELFGKSEYINYPEKQTLFGK